MCTVHKNGSSCVKEKKGLYLSKTDVLRGRLPGLRGLRRRPVRHPVRGAPAGAPRGARGRAGPTPVVEPGPEADLPLLRRATSKEPVSETD